MSERPRTLDEHLVATNQDPGPPVMGVPVVDAPPARNGWAAEGQADLTNSSFDREGNLTLTFTIHPESKYDLLPITDIKGRAFTIEVSTASHRVFAGRAGLEEARARVRRSVADNGG